MKSCMRLFICNDKRCGSYYWQTCAGREVSRRIRNPLWYEIGLQIGWNVGKRLRVAEHEKLHTSP